MTKKKHYGIYVKDDKLQAQLDDIDNISSWLLDLVKSYFAGTMTDKKEIDASIKQEKLTNLKIQRALSIQRIQETIARTKYLDAQTRFIEIFKRPMSLAAARAVKPGLSEPTPAEIVTHGSNYIACNLCPKRFDFEPNSPLQKGNAKEGFIDHRYQAHSLPLTALEAGELQKL